MDIYWNCYYEYTLFVIVASAPASQLQPAYYVLAWMPRTGPCDVADHEE